MRTTSVHLVVLGLALGLLGSACKARKARDACEEYLDAAEVCTNVSVAFPDSDCARAGGKDLDAYECLLAWAQDGCSSAGLAECV